MRNDQLHSLLKRVEGWPREAQQEAVQMLRGIEEEFFAGPVKPPSRSHESTHAATIVSYRVSFDLDGVGIC
jgi:hypothetical protein